MQADPVLGWIFPSLLLSLRIAPVFALAPPFSLVPAPPLFRMLFGVGVAACLAAAHPLAAAMPDITLASLASLAVGELMIGSIFVLAFQLAFGAIYMAGRTVDIQAGFGLAMLIDPATQTQTPLFGTLFAYLAGAIFFAMNGPAELLGLFGASLEAMPLGGAHFPVSIEPLTNFISTLFLTSFGVVGGIVLSLFLTDISIALLSRTVPQMNVLILGFQAKTLITLIVIPSTLGFSAAMLLRLMRLTLQTLPRLL